MLKLSVVRLSVLYVMFMAIVFPAMGAQVAPASATGEVEVVLSFRHDQVSIESDGIYDVVKLDGSVNASPDLGHPALPIHTVFVTIPADSHVTGLDIKSQESLYRENILVMPTQIPYSPSLPVPPFTDPNPAIYGLDTLYPTAVAVLGREHFMRGRKLVAVRVTPLRYLPAEKKLFLNSLMTLTVKYEETISAQGVSALVAPAPRPNALFDKMAASIVSNPQDITVDADDLVTVNLEPLATVDYLLISPESLTNAFQSLVDHRSTAAGGSYSTALVTTEHIYATYTGLDNQAKIRECIRAYVNSFDTMYVCLGGDSYGAGKLPDRDCYVTVGANVIPNMPTDLYYSDLDGTWDADLDGIYGEAYEDASEMDMMPDVIVGRITTRDEQESIDYVNKLIAYETNFEANNASYGRSMLMTGKALWTTYQWLLYGGDQRPEDNMFADGYTGYTDEDRYHNPVSDGEHHCRLMYRDYIQPYWSATNLVYGFDTVSKWDSGTGTNTGDFVCSGPNLMDMLNLEAGISYAWFWTHGSPFSMEGGLPFSVDEALGLTKLIAVLYTGSCNTAPIDSPGALSKSFIANANGGALSYMGSARFGWEPMSRDYAYEFWARVFKYGDKTVGDAFALHKAAMVPDSYPNWANRWLMFSVNLQGDPCMPLAGHYAMLDYDSSTVDDSALGNGDGFINADETVDLTPVVVNSGFEVATGVTGVLSSADSNITVVDATATFGTVGYPGTTTAADVFRITIDAACPTPTNASLTMVLTSAEGYSWTSAIPVSVYESSVITGTVTKVSDGTPMAGATVEYAGMLRGSVTTDPSGNYSFVAINGEYTVRAGMAGYAFSDVANVTTPPNATANFQLGAGIIALNPTNVVLSAYKNVIATNSFVVTNSGNIPLNVQILASEGSASSLDANQVDYFWVDIADSGTVLTEFEVEDAVTGAIPLGFGFEYYGATYSNLYISANGWVSFMEPSYSDPYNSTLPSSSYNVSIAFFWDDLNFEKGGVAYYETLDADTFVLTFEDVAHESLVGTITVQLIIKSDGTIKCQYLNVDYTSSHTVGFQNMARTRGYTASYNNFPSYTELTNNMAIALYPSGGTNWLSVSPEAVTLAVGASTQIVVSVAAGEMVGVYDTVFEVVSDDVVNPYITVPVSLTVLGNLTNHPPVVSNVVRSVDEDSGYTNMEIPYYDEDSDVVQIEVVAEPLHGRLSVGSYYIFYQPDANYFGEDSFTYRMHDYEEYGNIATAQVTVVALPDAPTASLSTPADDSFYDANVVIGFSATVYDADGNDTIATAVFETTNGITIGTGVYDGDHTHTLNSELEAGIHGWRVVATDDTGLAVTSTVRKITIAGNNPPVANAGPDCYVAAGQLAYLDGSGSSDPDNAQETLSFVWTQTGGPAVTLLDGTNMVASYMTESSGPHYFQLTVSDDEFDRTDTVTQTVNVVPVADDVSVQTFENTAVNIIPTYSDSDGPSNEFIRVTDALYGTFGLCDGNSFIYIPNEFVGGVYDQFDYVVFDGISNSAPATVTILIGELNGTNMVPYRESFESFRAGPSILGRKGWYSTDVEAAVISTNAEALSSLASYPDSYPLNETHTKLLKVTGTVSNLVTTSNLSGEDIRFDSMVMPARWGADLVPAVVEGSQVGLHFNVDGHTVVLARPASGQEPQWNTLTNSAVLNTGTWARVTIDQLYSQGESLFSVALGGAAPIVDEAIGTNVLPDTAKCWFIAANQANDYMSGITMVGEAYGDDMVVNLVDTNSFLSWMTEAYPGDTNYSATAGEDTDGDGHDSAQEYAAGTDPNSAASVFEVSTIEPKVGDELVLNWSSVAGKFYAIQYGSNLLSGLNSDGNSNIVATPPMNSYTVTVGETAPTLFYRVVVER